MKALKWKIYPTVSVSEIRGSGLAGTLLYRGLAQVLGLPDDMGWILYPTQTEHVVTSFHDFEFLFDFYGRLQKINAAGMTVGFVWGHTGMLEVFCNWPVAAPAIEVHQGGETVTEGVIPGARFQASFVMNMILGLVRTMGAEAQRAVKEVKVTLCTKLSGEAWHIKRVDGVTTELVEELWK